jgi:uncharacterized protein YpuA (DUF1002 family)
MDKLLEKFGLRYEDLNTIEKDTLSQWMQSINRGTLTIENIRDYIKQMKDSVEIELTRTNLNKVEDSFLKARLRNYMLFEGMLGGPDKAKNALERAMAGIASGIG